jgi:hypothetical protein
MKHRYTLEVRIVVLAMLLSLRAKIERDHAQLTCDIDNLQLDATSIQVCGDYIGVLFL